MMNRKSIVLLLILTLLLTACGGDQPVASGGTGPGRMVRRIEVAIHPADADYDRVYESQENMNALLSLLRSMETDVRPEIDPDINGGQVLYTATITYANGNQSIYYLLGHTYLRLGDADWCLIDNDLSTKFSTFIREHPTDIDSTPPETTAPAE